MTQSSTAKAENETHLELRPLVTMPDLCELLNVTRHTIHLWMRKGKFPRGALITPNKRIWRREAVLAWLEERERNEAKPQGAAANGGVL
jgi:predicted DNA-binding transcriptional regulator AlpA